MKTEQIEVPSFDGYKCVGFIEPIIGMYFVSVDGKKLHRVWESNLPIQLCYKKIEPVRKVLELVDECVPKHGDYVECEDGELIPYRLLKYRETPYSEVWRTINE